MSDLKYEERIKLEKLFEMDRGYVLDFSDNSMRAFVHDAVKIDIYEDKYKLGSGSKANRLRAFWAAEENYLVGKLIASLIEKWKADKHIREQEITPEEEELFNECFAISQRLKSGSVIEHIDAIQANDEEKDFVVLAELLKDSINRGEYGPTLDRIHTFMVKYVKKLCRNRSLDVGEDEPLHSRFGKYVKHLRDNNLTKSEMSLQILKAHNDILRSFNDVRNKQSYAHDNPILNQQESILILSNITSLIKYIDYLEQ
jgi:hypothetical protein